MTLIATLHRYPLLTAQWLELRNRLRRTGGARIATIAASVAAVLALVRYGFEIDLARLAAHWPVVFAVAALMSMNQVARRRRRLAADAGRSWLAAAPIAESDRRIAQAVRVLTPPLALAFAACVLLLAAAKSDASLTAAQLLSGAVSMGVLIGAAAGWIAARRGPRPRHEASRYTPAITGARTLAPSDRALSHWPIAQALAWGRPENLRGLVIVCLLLGVQAGSSALHGLLVVAAWLLAGYLSSLLIAVPTTANVAARWLRSTPLAPFAFGWALMRRALVHQAIGTAIAALAISAVGSPLNMTIMLCALWMGIVFFAWSVGVRRACR